MDIKEIFSNAVHLIHKEVKEIYKLQIDCKESPRIRKSINVKYPSINAYFPVHQLFSEKDVEKISHIMKKRALNPIESSINSFLFDTASQAEQAVELYYQMITEKALNGEILFDYFFAQMSKREGVIDLENSELEFFFLRNGTHIRSAILQLNKNEDFPLLNHERSIYWK